MLSCYNAAVKEEADGAWCNEEDIAAADPERKPSWASAGEAQGLRKN
jgi:hypothetical protein